jgi:GT2 family glycosyltransferase
MKKTSVIILNWNGKKLLERFIPTVLAHSLSDDNEVVVADNGSTDDSIDFLKTQFPNIPLILLDKNYGFADGYNRAIQQIDSEYVVLLNSDVETTENWLQTLTDFMDVHPEVAAVQPKILAYNDKEKFEYAGAAGGFIDRYGYPFCRGRILDVIETDTGQYDEPISVFWATGACLCIRRKDYIEVGGLDARFFAHMEEIDLCWRLNARGWGVMCVPSSAVYHVGGASLSKENPKKMYLNFRNNLLMIYKNVQSSDFLSIFVMRYVLDFLAFIHLLLRGNFKNAQAIIKAHRNFLKMKPSYKSIRYENLSKAIVPDISTQYKKSILWKFYFAEKKTYSSLFRQSKN